MALPFALSPPEGLVIGLAILGAAFIRGYSGFGFAAIVMLVAGLVTDPRHFVAVVTILDVAVIFQQWREIRGDVDWRRVAALMAGAAPALPVGLWLMAGLDTDMVRAAIAAYVLLMCGVLAAGLRLARPAGLPAHAGVGIASGLASAAAIGGLPVAAFFAAQPLAAAVFRATLIAYFALLDVWTAPMLWTHGLVSGESFVAAALALPPMMLGIRLGSRRFLRAAPQGFRRFAIGLLTVLALAGLVRALA